MDFDIDLGDIDTSSDFTFKAPINKKVNVIDDNILFNKKHISDDILSSHTRSESSSEAGDLSSDDSPYESNFSNDEDDQFEQMKGNRSFNNNNINNNMNNNMNNNNMKDIMSEKRELLYQFQRLKKKNIQVPYEFSMDSDINHMRSTYERIKRDKEIDASINFQRKMLMGAVTGFEFLNTRYDPFAIELNGWSEQVHEGITDYDDIFEELHEKYKSTGSDMAPEVRLLISLSGSAFMFHLTKRMFSESKLPNVEEVLKNNPQLMKQFQQASAKEFMYQNTNTQQQNQSQPPLPQTTRNPIQSQENDIFGMVSSMFNSSPQDQVDNIINNVHSQININPTNGTGIDDKLETMTMTDEEINSIIDSIGEETGISTASTKNKVSTTKKRTPNKNIKVLSL